MTEQEYFTPEEIEAIRRCHIEATERAKAAAKAHGVTLHPRIAERRPALSETQEVGG